MSVQNRKQVTMSCESILLLLCVIGLCFFLKIKVLLIMKKYQWKKYSVKGYCDSKFKWLSDNLKNSFHEYKINAFSCYRYAKKNEGGAGYYQHFLKNFIRPYGLALNDETFQDATLARQLKSINCEFMVCPHIAMSELSEIMTENWKYIGENIAIFDIDAIKEFLGKVESVLESFQVVNQKDQSRKRHFNCSSIY